MAGRSLAPAQRRGVGGLGPLAREIIHLAVTTAVGITIVTLLIFAPQGIFNGQTTSAGYLDSVRDYLLGLLRGNLGKTMSGRPVARELGYAAQHSLQLLGVSLAATLPLGIGWGALLAMARRGVAGAIVFGLNTLFNSLPSFVLLLLAMESIANLTQRTGFRLLPIQGYGMDEHVILPAAILAIRGGAYLARAIQVAHDDILRQDWVQAARAKGLGGLRLWRSHVLPALRAPFLGASLGTLRVLIGSMVIVDYMVNWRGLTGAMLRSDGSTAMPTERTIATGAAIILVLFFVLSDAAGRLLLRANNQAPAMRLGAATGGKLNAALLLGGAIALAIVACAALAPLIAPYDPQQTILRFRDGQMIRLPYAPGTPGMPLGSDTFGRDMLSRLIYGARYTVLFCGVAALLRVALGVLLGMLAGWYARADRLVAIVASAFASIPSLIFAMMPIVLVNYRNMGLATSTAVFLGALSLTGWAEIAVHVRAAVQHLRGSAFVEAAYTTGLTRGRVLWRHILPNLRDLILVEASYAMGAALLLVAELGFLGAYIGGVAPQVAPGGRFELDPIYAEWGSMLGVGLRQRGFSWLLIEPALVFTASILAFNLLAEGLRRRR